LQSRVFANKNLTKTRKKVPFFTFFKKCFQQILHFCKKFTYLLLYARFIFVTITINNNEVYPFDDKGFAFGESNGKTKRQLCKLFVP
jgi:hypothetical protein